MGILSTLVIPSYGVSFLLITENFNGTFPYKNSFYSKPFSDPVYYPLISGLIWTSFTCYLEKNSSFKLHKLIKHRQPYLKGKIFVINAIKNKLIKSFRVGSSNNAIKQIKFARKGEFFLVNSFDRYFTSYKLQKTIELINSGIGKKNIFILFLVC